MAQATWITFGILAVSCSAHFGFNQNERFQQRYIIHLYFL